MSLGGGGGGGGDQTVSQKWEPPDYTKPGWEQYYNNALGNAARPYQQSPYPTVAPFNDFQQESQNMLYDRATMGAPDLNAGRGAVTSIASGGQQNPWQAMLAGTASGANSNPFLGGAAEFAGASGNNPYMADPEAMIKATSADMTRAAQLGPMAQTDAASNRAGAYGGSDWQLGQAANAGELARGIGSMSANARLAANAQNANTWQQAQQGKLGALGLGMSGYDSDIGRQIQAAMGGGSMYGQDVNAMLSAAGLSGSLSQDDWTSISALMNGGNIYGAYDQALLNAGNQEYGNQSMYPYLQNEQLGGSLSRASGGQGSSTQTVPGYSPYWNIAGLLAAGAGAYYGSK